MRKFCGFILKFWGWKIDKNIPDGSDRCVLVFAPHTSAWDFVVGKLAMVSLGLVSGFIIKKEAFWFPLGILLHSFGAIPIDRKYARKMPIYATMLFKKYDRLSLMIAPEGTRKRTDNWKKGFYYVSTHANVPMAIAYIDWKTKTAGIAKIMTPTGDYEKDLAEIQDVYKGMQGKNKGCFNLEQK